MLAHKPHHAPTVGREVLMALFEELKRAAQPPAEKTLSLMNAVIAPVGVHRINTQSPPYPLRYPSSRAEKEEAKSAKKKGEDRAVCVFPYSSAYLQSVLHGTGDALQAI